MATMWYLNIMITYNRCINIKLRYYITGVNQLLSGFKNITYSSLPRLKITIFHFFYSPNPCMYNSNLWTNSTSYILVRVLTKHKKAYAFPCVVRDRHYMLRLCGLQLLNVAVYECTVITNDRVEHPWFPRNERA